MKFFQVLIFFICSFFLSQDGFQLDDHKKKQVIPFQLINNLIFIPLTVNGVELTFMLDSGVGETILFSFEDKEVSFKNVKKTKFRGLGGTMEVEGLEAIKNHVKIGDHLQDFNHTLFIILDEDFNVSSHVGIPVNGVIGYHLFKNYKMKVDYLAKKITLYAKNTEVNLKGYDEFPITIELNKPYIMADVEQVNQRVSSKLLLDLGNSDAIWLFPSVIKDFVYNRPNIDDYLGRGFNGDIYGKRSRIHHLYIGKHKIVKPTAAMPDEYSVQNLRFAPNRKGSIGDEILRRFHIIFDYPSQKVYLKKNRNFDDPFHLNMSGLDIRHNGMIWDKDVVRVTNPPAVSHSAQQTDVITAQGEFQYKFTLKPEYIVAGTRKDSPAQKAGIMKDDKIVRINARKASDMSLNQIYELMKSEEGRKIYMELERNGETIKKEIQLEDPIPYLE